MRIIAVPLARHRGNASLPYITYLARSAAQKALMENKSVPVASESWSQRAMVRASEIWTSFGRTDVQSAFNWKRRLFTIGESIMDRIEYEEWALKSIDQVLGPTIRDLMISSHKREKQPEKVRSTIMLIPDFPSLPPKAFVSKYGRVVAFQARCAPRAAPLPLLFVQCCGHSNHYTPVFVASDTQFCNILFLSLIHI